MIENEFLLEKEVRLSQSILWDLQKKAYTQFGPEAWFEKSVPFYLTSNPLIARQYAQIITAFIKDCLRANIVQKNAPFYIFDLGAGTGRFAYLFLNEIMGMIAHLPIEICYVMTDIVDANIQSWKNHPYFQSYLKNKSLDFAYYDHQNKQMTFELLYSRQTLNSEQLKNPLIIIANYFFDTIPQDLYCVNNHTLYEGRISLKSKIKELVPSIIPHLTYNLNQVPLSYSLEPLEKKILLEYAAKYQNIPYFLFPTGPLQVISHFKQFSKNGVLFLTGDQGITSADQLLNPIPFFSKHDSFSMLVNYNALKECFCKTNHFCKLTSNSDTKLVHMVAACCPQPLGLQDVEEVFRLTLNSFGPQAYFNLVESIMDKLKDLNLEFLLSLIQLGLGDPINFNVFFPEIRKNIPFSTQVQQEELIQMIHATWKVFFPIHPKEGAFVMNLGVLCFDLKKYDEAILYFERALSLGYQEPFVYQNLNAAKTLIATPNLP